MASVLEQYTAEAGDALSEAAPNGSVRCFACAHQCLVAPGGAGVCKVRSNRGGRLRVPHGYTAGLQCDPIEKKPFFHVLPGSEALSFGMLGCNFHCGFCQNWVSSQALRDPHAIASFSPTTADKIVSLARRHGAASVISTYNEPLITSEWAVEIFSLAKAHGMRCGYVSNGHANNRVLDYLAPVIDMFKVDLKCFREEPFAIASRLDP